MLGHFLAAGIVVPFEVPLDLDSVHSAWKKVAGKKWRSDLLESGQSIHLLFAEVMNAIACFSTSWTFLFVC